jgi:hypothetical protein
MPPGDKKLSTEEIERIAQWIDSGASTLRAEPETLAIGEEVFTEEERQHWAFLRLRSQRFRTLRVRNSSELRSTLFS